MRYAIIVNNYVINIVNPQNESDLALLDQTGFLHVQSDDAQVGDGYDPDTGTFTAPAPAPVSESS